MYIKTVVLNAFCTTYFVNKLYDFDEEQFMFLTENNLCFAKSLTKDQDMF